jgi:hypothetical protein
LLAAAEAVASRRAAPARLLHRFLSFMEVQGWTPTSLTNT